MTDLVLFEDGFRVSELNRISLSFDNADDTRDERLATARYAYQLSNNIFSSTVGGVGPHGAIAAGIVEQFTTGWLNDHIAQIHFDSEQDRRTAIESMGIYAQQIMDRDRAAFSSHLQNPSRAQYNIRGIRHTVNYLRQNSNLRDEIRIPLIQELAINAQRDIDQLRLQIPHMITALNDQISRRIGENTQAIGVNTQAIEDLRNQLAGIVSDAGQVSTTLGDLGRSASQQGAAIGRLQSQMGDAERAIGRLDSRLNDQNARLTDVEQVTDLVVNELSRVDTHGLGAYDAQIAHFREAHLRTLESSTSTDTDRLVSAARLNQAVALRMQEVRRVEGQLNTFFAVTNMVGQLGQMVGSTEVQQVAQIASAAAQIGVGISALAGIGGATIEAIAGGATLGPAGMIAGGVMALFSAFSSSQGSSGIATALRGISEQLAALQRQIADLGTYMGQRFDRVEGLLFDQNRLIMMNFRQTIELLSTLQRTMMQEFLTTQGRIDALERIGLQIVSELSDVRNTMAQGFSTLYSQDYQRILTQIVGYYDHQRYGQVPRLSETSVRQAMLSMIDWSRNGVKNPIFHGDGAGNYALSQVLNIPVGEAAQHANFLLGILRAQGIVFAPQALPSNLTQPIHNQTCTTSNLGTRVIDPFAFASVVGSIFKFIDRVPEYEPQRQDRCQLEILRLLAQQYLEVTLAAKTDARPVHLFLDLYQSQINALIQFIYKTIVETLNVRGPDIDAERVRLLSSLPSLESSTRHIATLLDQFSRPITNIQNTLSNSCYACGSACFSCGDRTGSFGRGYCTDPNFASHLPSLRNGAGSAPYDYGCLTSARVMRDARTDGTILAGPSPHLPISNCHNANHIQVTVTLKQGVETRARHIYPYTANDINRLGQRLSNELQWNASQAQLSISPNALNRLDIFNNSLNQLPSTPLAGLSATQFFTIFTQQVTACHLYIRWQCCSYAFGQNILINDHERGGNYMPAINSNIASAQPMLTPINQAGSTTVSLLSNTRSAIDSLVEKIRKAQLLNVSSLYYLQNPNDEHLNTMLQTTLNWFTSHSTASDRARVIQALLSSISNQARLHQILENLDIAKRGLALFLEFAFAEEYQADMASQLAVRMMFNGSDVRSSLHFYNPNGATAPQIFEAILNQTTTYQRPVSVLNVTSRQTGGTINITMADPARPNASTQTYTVNATIDTVVSNRTTLQSYRFLNSTWDYFTTRMAVGRNATQAGILMPAYRWLLSLVGQIVTYRDYVFPTGLSLHDFTPTRILSAIRTNESQILDLLSNPLLNLTDSRDPSGNTALLLGANGCDANAISGLLALGANPNAVNTAGYSAANGASACPFDLTRINLIIRLLTHNITRCRATDQLRNAMLEVRQAHPTAPLGQLTCIQLSPPGPTTTPGPTHSTPPVSIPPGGSTPTTISTTPAPTVNETSDSDNASDDGGDDSTLNGVIAIFVIFAAVACCVMAYQQGQIAQRNNPGNAPQGNAGAGGHGDPGGNGGGAIPAAAVNQDQPRRANDGAVAFMNPMYLPPRGAWDQAGRAWQHQNSLAYDTTTMLLTLFGIMAASHLAEEATLLEAAREANLFGEPAEPFDFDNQEESTETPDFENHEESWRHNDSLKNLYKENLAPHTHMAEYLVIRHGVNDTMAHALMQPFNDFVGNLMLLQVIIHVVRSHLFSTESEARAPTHWVERDKVNTGLMEKMQRAITFNASKLEGLKAKHPQQDFSWADFCLDEHQCRLNELNQTNMVDAGALESLRADMRCFKREMRMQLDEIHTGPKPSVVGTKRPDLATTHGLFVETPRSIPACIDWTRAPQLPPAH